MRVTSSPHHRHAGRAAGQHDVVELRDRQTRRRAARARPARAAAPAGRAQLLSSAASSSSMRVFRLAVAGRGCVAARRFASAHAWPVRPAARRRCMNAGRRPSERARHAGGLEKALDQYRRRNPRRRGSCRRPRRALPSRLRTCRGSRRRRCRRPGRRRGIWFRRRAVVDAVGQRGGQISASVSFPCSSIHARRAAASPLPISILKRALDSPWSKPPSAPAAGAACPDSSWFPTAARHSSRPGP